MQRSALLFFLLTLCASTALGIDLESATAFAEAEAYIANIPNQDDVLRWTAEMLNQTDALEAESDIDRLMQRRILPALGSVDRFKGFMEPVPEEDPRNVELYKRASLFAAVAYCRSSRIETWTCGSRCEGLAEGSKVLWQFSVFRTDTVGYLAVQEATRTIWLSFRGSLTIRNWFNNFKFFKTKLAWSDQIPGDVAVHRGFYVTYDAVREALSEQAKKAAAQYPGYTLMVTGHSLGGALASLAALDLRLHHVPPSMRVRLINFGQPRVGNTEYERFFHSIFAEDTPLRSVQNRDPVPHIPPPIGYAHAIREMWVTPDGSRGAYKTLMCSDQYGEDPYCSTSISRLFLNPLDHAHAWDTNFGPFC